MNTFLGKIIEIRVNADLQKNAVIACPKNFFPKPGQYLQGHALSDLDSPTSVSLFPSEYHLTDGNLLVAAPIPSHWQPGDMVNMRGPLGKGFLLPLELKRLTLITIDVSIDRLLPLAKQALQQQIEVAIFTNSNLPPLSTQIEANPLSASENGINWADFVAIDTPLLPYGKILEKIGASTETPLPSSTQILIQTPMPCGDLGECGVCTIIDKNNKPLLVCKDGPVFKLTHMGYEKNQ